MLRYTIRGVLASLVLALGFSSSSARADDWDDYRERLEDLRERQRERYEDWLEDQREAREDYLDWLEDQRERQRDWNRRGGRAVYPGYFPGPVHPGNWRPVYPGTWYPAPRYYPSNYGWYDTYRPGGFSIRGPRGRVFSIRW